MKVTKEDVEKAEAYYYAAAANAAKATAAVSYDHDYACDYAAAAVEAAVADADKAWDKYIKLKREYYKKLPLIPLR